MKPVQTLCALALFAGGTLLISGHAVAGEPDAPPQRIVKFGDLNLNHPEGVKVLYNRLAQASYAVCHTMPSTPYMTGSKAMRKCVQEALDRAVTDVNNRNLTAYYNKRTGRHAGEDKFAER
jgi:UrcA family protein